MLRKSLVFKSNLTLVNIPLDNKIIKRLEKNIDDYKDNNTQFNNNLTLIKIKEYEKYDDVNFNKIYLNTLIEANDFWCICQKLNPSPISSEKRKEILEYLKYFSDYYELNHTVLYYTVFLFDYFVRINTKEKLLDTEEEIGIAALIISIKFLGEKHISLKEYSELYENVRFDIDKIRDIEMKGLFLLSHLFPFSSPITLLSLIMHKGLLCSIDFPKVTPTPSFIHRFSNFLISSFGKVIFSNDYYFSVKPDILCFCVLIYSRKVFDLDGWNWILEEIFNFNPNEFLDVYKKLFGEEIKIENKKKRLTKSISNKSLTTKKSIRSNTLTKHNNHIKFSIINQYRQNKNNQNNKLNLRKSYRFISSKYNYKYKRFFNQINEENKENDIKSVSKKDEKMLNEIESKKLFKFYHN